MRPHSRVRGGRGICYDEWPSRGRTIMSRALLVIDVQNEYFEGALPITHPGGHLENILRVMDAAAGKVPTVVIQHHTNGLPIFRKDSKEWELHPEIAKRPRDLLIQKTLPGSFTGTPL